MSLSIEPSAEWQGAEIAAGLWRLAALPHWLLTALQPKRVSEALARHVPEFATGALKLRDCKIKRLLLKDTSGRWIGSYTIVVKDQQSDEKQTIVLDGTLAPPQLRPAATGAEQPAPAAFGTTAWRCYLPELGLELATQPPDAALAAMPQLTDSEQARALLEQAIGAAAPAYHGLRLQKCTPEVLSYKPGSRGTILYHLKYPSQLANRGWPATVIGKTYRKDSKAKNAYDGMLALWNSPLAAGDIVTIAEPLAYVPELKLMVQSPIAEELTLEDLLKSALSEGDSEHLEELHSYMRKAAHGLAALHQSGVQHGDLVSLEGRFPEISELIERLAVPVPELGEAAAPLLARLEAYAAAHPAGALVPTHGTFNPEQVLIPFLRNCRHSWTKVKPAEPDTPMLVLEHLLHSMGLYTAAMPVGAAPALANPPR